MWDTCFSTHSCIEKWLTQTLVVAFFFPLSLILCFLTPSLRSDMPLFTVNLQPQPCFPSVILVLWSGRAFVSCSFLSAGSAPTSSLGQWENSFLHVLHPWPTATHRQWSGSCCSVTRSCETLSQSTVFEHLCVNGIWLLKVPAHLYYVHIAFFHGRVNVFTWFSMISTGITKSFLPRKITPDRLEAHVATDLWKCFCLYF